MFGYLLGHLNIVMAVVSIVLSMLAGRGLARRLHDVQLLGGAGRSIPLFSFSLKALIGLIAFINILEFMFARMASFTFSALYTGSETAALISTVLSAVSFTASLAVFSKRYRGVRRPLTREGALVYRFRRLGRRL